jgi:hypothetical protein
VVAADGEAMVRARRSLALTSSARFCVIRRT